MADNKTSKADKQSVKPADVTKVQKDEDVTDFPAAGEADTSSNAAPAKKSSEDTKLMDPREDEFVPAAISEDAAREVASSEYVSFDQPLDEETPPPDERKNGKGRSVSKGSARQANKP